ncbi:caspase family protein [Desertifilum sp. FACHB-1129]|uniref:Peptidase C14 n=1 Tax=Desertifilum tharense IPPAS B-1220 TaxID=1781255 RepID=A0A1E5QL41_9CYAN|nr:MULTISPECIES: caspase family protein [Desertifilum]MDA0212097.1 caspase family protein [Cyanobacteria bacterium FC1]MBD2314099.1 caspase family protein [Desertifilum sp. FACHB-1129]MBD2323584.1 caspase family protein [Desertifilum sp. FACHB-866]MBD2335036.1 caspase family protein [Desertifilum sp. FACHB-868]OEJ75402.1 peptidase C14 [Desertifilum tharense IPPAS B-1220]
MVSYSRRQFLRFASLSLASLGLSQFPLWQQGDRYGKVLAQGSSRKVALLVGINQYSSAPLEGCITDVELQRHLLIHRFGFNPKDIHTLTDSQATRQNLLDAFEEYLIKPVKAGDVAVYHFSGHGSRVFDPDPIPHLTRSDGTGLNGTLVPADGHLPNGYPSTGGTVKDIMGHTLFLLMSAVPTENFTAVLDSCYSGGATRRDFRVRSRQGGRQLEVSPEEKAYQEKWLSKLQLSREEYVRRYREGVAKGVVFAASRPNQTAADAPFNGFAAGAFTYLLTQYLWEQTGTPESAIAHIVPQIPRRFYQIPIYEVKPQSDYADRSVYFLKPSTPPASAVLTARTGQQANIWLGGLTPQGIAELEPGTQFTPLQGSGKAVFQSREGLVGTVTLEGNLQPGTLLQKG